LMDGIKVGLALFSKEMGMNRMGRGRCIRRR